ncbi:MAG: energy-coupling factor transporter transmembrane protein EcfT [Treponema sp.]|jgi:energy-coupling factor transport system permease protein|nr:energy-coupling factor transporter transmembrane protein EcfT [Treponema sp.]
MSAMRCSAEKPEAPGSHPHRRGGRMLSYIERESPVHALTGAVKCIVFLLWSILTMVGYDTRVMAVMAGLGLLLFYISHIKFREVAFICKVMSIFLALNLAAVYLFAPEQGVAVYHTRHILFEGAGRFTLTKEQLFYEFNIFLKYIMIIPPAILLVVCTHPSEFAASLNRMGLPYTIAYAVSLTMRYIPDVQRDYETISRAQQARGIELAKRRSDGKRVPPLKRLQGSLRLLLPLILLSLDRIDVVSHALELRGFGKHKKRTWYAARPFSAADIAVLAAALLLFVLGLWFTFRDGDRFYNPFL